MIEALNRRGLFRTAVRAVLATGLGALGLLSLRKGRGTDHTCSNNWICRGCGFSSGCVLPQALSYRRAARKGKS